MAQPEWIAAEWGLTATNRRARFYSLTAAGRRQLQAQKRNWQALTPP
jgi:PadR family transcriptional regulator, regulatory protein PadR